MSLSYKTQSQDSIRGKDPGFGSSTLPFANPTDASEVYNSDKLKQRPERRRKLDK